ncbi:malate dehydrogenase (quinone) [Homoserinimonas aerilata]|uniref:Probable malate:quinone oxidoreductase n=1 Tax=Homoserinimonas aerilata TaxID=1162970 RepID=A0A542YKZ3_9MICO|nr:malate:quinone oxidoreductase [Homoserinimonas aerilata]TQL48762.1 malate dehydrogenase (quinone) [Homoserinimonas aerilata]
MSSATVSAQQPLDVALIGGGVMSATLGAIIKQLQPDWSIEVFEALSDVALESSNPWNNAGTGHAALCELNYTKEQPDGTFDISSAVNVNEQFQVSRQFWSYLVEKGLLPEPQNFINPVPHMSFVWGEENVDYLRRRFEALKDHPLFDGMEFSDDPAVIRSWTPLLLPGRAKSQPIAATRVPSGTDVDFGALTRNLFSYLTDNGAVLTTERKVTGLKRQRDGLWRITSRHTVGATPAVARARFVFVGAGGGALSLLQKSGIPEAKGFGGFPISGQFLRTDDPAIVARHQAKVYGKASVGAPPMSVPHLDTRVVNGEASLMFGPYAGFSPKFLKSGSWFDLPFSLRPSNIIPMLAVGKDNFDLVRYLVGELLASRTKKLEALQAFMPEAKDADWKLITAGQRVQVIKKDAKKGGVLQFGTEVVASADGSIAGLLGASPGASTAVPIMLSLLERCFPSEFEGWRPRVLEMVPSFGTKLSDDPQAAAETMAATGERLAISQKV